MQKVTLRHVSGVRANQLQEFPADGLREITIGRDPSCHIQFDAERDDLVSRYHARISPDAAQPGQYTITDLGSRNGTLVNRQRVYGASRLSPGDTVQLGPGGPELRFDLDPRPQAPVRPTRLAVDPQSAPPPTREGGGFPLTGMTSPAPPSFDSPRPVGRATVERMISGVMKQVHQESSRVMRGVIAAVTVVAILLGGAYFLRREKVALDSDSPTYAANPPAYAGVNSGAPPVAPVSRRSQAPSASRAPQPDSQPAPPAAPPAQPPSQDARVRDQGFVEWLRGEYEGAKKKLDAAPADTAKSEPARLPAEGPPAAASSLPPVPAVASALSKPPSVKDPSQIAQENMDAVVQLEVSWKLEDADTGKPVYHVVDTIRADRKRSVGCSGSVSLFRQTENGIEPLLISTDDGGKHIPIAGQHSGTGFIVSSDGFVLTNRHVAYSWESPYDWPAGMPPPCLIAGSSLRPMTAGELPQRWIPSQASMLISSLTHDPKAKTFYPGLTRRNLQGDAKIEVAFAKSKDRFSAKNVRPSDRHDVSLLKVDVPFAAKRVEINDNYDSVNEGDAVVVMGYPGIAPKVAAVTKSQDMFNERSSIRGIVLPSVTSGVVMTIVRNQSRMASTDTTTYSFMGDLYQLALNTTGPGNSGGPVLDSSGRAIAIFNSGIADGSGTRTSGAVPVRYGVELMRVNRVQR